MSKTNIKFRVQSLKEERASIDPVSFVVTWQNHDTLHEVYEAIEGAWNSRPDGFESRRRFYTTRAMGYKQLRARATKYRKKGVELKPLRGETNRAPGWSRVDYEYLAALAESELTRQRSIEIKTDFVDE
jgi:hypothetical protein|tara:strand:- start:2770 stop:3156 length:387 start_codon:yes stop_codon:yes gene_type:complete